MIQQLIRNKFFWLSTLVTVILAGAILWFGYPSLVATFRAGRSENSDLDQKIAAASTTLATLRSLEKKQDELANVYTAASTALPVKPENNLLGLELDGLLKSLSLPSVIITIPYGVPAPAAGTASTGSTVSFTLAGSMDFSTTKKLLAALRTLERWNRVTTLDITKNGTLSTVTVSGTASYRAAKTDGFTGDANFLNKAETLFTTNKAYTTVPDATTEGNFGKSDPFVGP